jgi:hypothetical protein
MQDARGHQPVKVSKKPGRRRLAKKYTDFDITALSDFSKIG